MRRKILVSLLILTLLPIVIPVAATERVPVIIMFKDKPDVDLVRRHGGEVKAVYHIEPALAASVPPQAIDALSRNPNVDYIVEDLEIFLVEERYDWGVDRIDADLAHPYNNGTGVNIVIMDTGIDYTHPELDDNYAGGYDFSAANDPDPMDHDGHGTHVAGIAAAEYNGIGIIGVAPEANLWAVKVFTDDGVGYYSDVVEALEWCIDTLYDDDPNNNIQIISMSFGSKVEYGDPGIEAWINDAYIGGILLVGAAGNEGNPPGRGDNIIYPARYENVIAVAATNSDDERPRWSSTGPSVELAAPGVDITSTYLGGTYKTWSGTSMATPHVSGTAALVIASGITDASGDGKINDDVRQRLQATADDLGPAGRDEKYGYGLVDADEACGAVTSPPPAQKVESISVAVSTDKLKYTMGEKVYVTIDVTGTTNTGDVIPVDAYVTSKIITASGRVYGWEGSIGSDGTVTLEFKIKKPDGIGTYTVTADASYDSLSGHGETTFEVT